MRATASFALLVFALPFVALGILFEFAADGFNAGRNLADDVLRWAHQD